MNCLRKQRKIDIVDQTRYKWLILFVAVFSTIVYTVAFQSVPPMIPLIIKELSISDAQAGLIMSTVIIPGLLLGLPSGWLLTRYAAKKVGFVTLMCIIIASFIASISYSFELLLFGRLLLGFGGILNTITCLVIISQWFGNKDLGKAMGIFGASIPLTVLITFPSVSLVMENFGWRFPFYVTSLLGVIALVIFFVVITDGPYSKEKTVKVCRKDCFNPELWKLGLLCLCVQGAAFSFSTWAPTLFAEFTNMSIVQASFLAGLASLPKIFSLPFFGYLSDKMGKRRPFLILGPLLMSVALFSLVFSSNLTMVCSVLFMGVATTIISSVVNVIPTEILGRSKAGIGFGVISVFGSLGGVLSAPLIGFLMDETGSFAASLIGMGTFSAAGVVLALTLKTK